MGFHKWLCVILAFLWLCAGGVVGYCSDIGAIDEKTTHLLGFLVAVFGGAWFLYLLVAFETGDPERRIP